MDHAPTDGQAPERDPWETALEGLELVVLDPATCTLTLDAHRRLSGSVNGRPYAEIVAYMPFPLTLPTEWVSLVSVTDADSDGRRSDGSRGGRVEIGVLPGLDGLDPESREAVATALRLRYFMPKVQRIVAVWDEDAGQSGAVYWELDTDRGVMRMRMPNLFEGIQELTTDRLVLSDYDGNRAEIVSVAGLDAESRRLLQRYYWF